MHDQSGRTAPLILSFSCSEKWELMAGGDAVRNCAQCSSNVQNISDYTPLQIEQLLKKVDAGEEICVAFRAPVGVSISVPIISAGNSSTEVHPAAELSLKEAAKLYAWPASFPVKRFSVAVAASISLSYLPPTESLSAFAKSVEGRNHQAGPLSKPSVVDSARAPVNSKGDIVKIAPEDHGLWAGRPAPSAIRDLVNDIEPCTEMLDTPRVKPQMDIFQRDLNNGQISEQAVEDLAAAYTKYGPAGKARTCYSLLIKLAEKHPVSPAKIKQWHEKVRWLAPSEFNDEIAQYERESKQKRWTSAITHLLKANKVRTTDVSLSKQFRWSFIASRLDKLYDPLQIDQQYYFLASAFNLEAAQGDLPEHHLWLKNKRNTALTVFAQVVAVADREISLGQYRLALDEMHRALQIGTIDPTVSTQCDWSSALKRLEIIERFVEPSYKNDCKSLIALMKQSSK